MCFKSHSDILMQSDTFTGRTACCFKELLSCSLTRTWSGMPLFVYDETCLFYILLSWHWHWHWHDIANSEVCGLELQLKCPTLEELHVLLTLFLSSWPCFDGGKLKICLNEEEIKGMGADFHMTCWVDSAVWLQADESVSSWQFSDQAHECGITLHTTHERDKNWTCWCHFPLAIENNWNFDKLPPVK